jgi:hypothetical protein
MIKLELAYNDIVEDEFYSKTIVPLIDGKFSVSLYGQRHEVKMAKEKFGDQYTYTVINNMPITDFNEIQAEIDFNKKFEPEKIVCYSYLLGASLIKQKISKVYASVINSIRSAETANELKHDGYTGFVLAHDKVFDVKFQKECKNMDLKLIGLTTIGCPPCNAFSERHQTLYMTSNFKMSANICPARRPDFNPIKLNILPPSYMMKDDFKNIDEYKFSGRFIKYPQFVDIYKDLLASFLNFDDEKFTYLMFKHFIFNNKVDDKVMATLHDYTKFYLANKKTCAYHCWECGEHCDEKFKRR